MRSGAAIPTAGANAELDKTKSTNGKIGRSTTSENQTTKLTGDFPKQPSDPWVAQIKRSNSIALTRILRSLQPLNGNWVQCPKCCKDWNRLTPKGVCLDCETRR